MTDTWDDDDRAIARALGADAADTEAIGDDVAPDDLAVAEYEAVLAHLPFDAVAPRRSWRKAWLPRHSRAGPRPHEPWTVGEAHAICAGRHRDGGSQPARPWWPRPRSSSRSPSAARRPARARPARVSNLPPQPTAWRGCWRSRGTRRGVLHAGTGTTVGRVALGPDGQGYLYDLPAARSSAQWLWLETPSGPVRVGRMTPSSTVHFVVHGDVDAVNGVFVTNDATPGSPTARAELS